MERINGSRCQLKSIIQDVENVMPVEKAQGAGISVSYGARCRCCLVEKRRAGGMFFVLPNGASNFGRLGLPFCRHRGPRKLAGFTGTDGLQRYWEWGSAREITGFVRLVWLARFGSATLADGRPGSPGLGRRLFPSLNTNGRGTYKHSSVSSWAARGKAVRLSNESRDLAWTWSSGKFVVSNTGGSVRCAS